MKKGLLIFVVLLLTTSIFGLTLETGKSPAFYYPVDVNSTSSAIVTKVAPINEDYYEVVLNISGVSFSYCVKIGSNISLKYRFGNVAQYLETFVVTEIEPNKVVLELVSKQE